MRNESVVATATVSRVFSGAFSTVFSTAPGAGRRLSVRHEVRCLIGAALLAVGSPVFAAEADADAAAAAATAADTAPPAPAQAPAASDAGLAEVVVTGSRLNRPGMTSPTPVTAVTADELAEQNPQSLTQGLAQLPALANSTVPTSMGGRTTLGPGNFLNLRNLGPTRTLILLDGERVAPSNMAGNVDVNLLPQALVSSVDIVTGGASAAYGSDAVAGVINYVLDTKFTGFKADVNTGVSGVADGAAQKVSLAWGRGFLDDRLHVEGSFDWRHSQPAYADNRSWADQHCGLIPTGVSTAAATPQNPYEVQACNVTQSNSAYGGVLIGAPWATSTGSISFGPGGVPQPFVYGAMKTGTTQVGGTGDPVSLGDVVNFAAPMDNKVLFGRVSYDVTSQIQAFTQVSASRTDTTYAQTPPYFNGSNVLTINSGNPFIPTSIQNTMNTDKLNSLQLGITPVDWGNIVADDAEQSYDVTLGLKGKFGGSYNWNVHAEHSRTQFRELYENDVNLVNLYQALNVVTGPLGTPVCSVALANPSSACQPLNVFGQGSASPGALAYIHGTGEEWNVVSQTDLAANINGEPFSLWAGPVSVGTGIEWRRLEGAQTSDAISQQNNNIAFAGVLPAGVLPTGGWLTTNALPYSGSETVTEGYIETLIPLLKDQFLARSLDLNAAGRVTSYSQSGTVDTWKAGLTWTPVDELLVRVTESSDIRAPGLSDLYSPVSLGPPGQVHDPITNTNVLVSSGSIGNPDLKPEKARTFTGGFTWQPHWVPGFGLSVDYYDIKIADVLAAVSATDTLNRCALGEQVFCGNVIRNSSGAIEYIVLPEENLSQARTRGVDFEANYHVDLGGGRLSFRGVATRLLEQSTTTTSATGSVYQDLGGSLGISPGASILSSYPGWLFSGTTNYDIGPWGLNLVARLVGGGAYYEASPYNSASYLDTKAQEIPSVITFNAGVRYRFLSVTGAPEVYLQVSNLFDKAPPVFGNTSLIGFQTAGNTYDAMGRYFTLGVKLAL